MAASKRDENIVLSNFDIFDFTIFYFSFPLERVKNCPLLLVLPTQSTIILPYPDFTVLPLTNTGDL